MKPPTPKYFLALIVFAVLAVALYRQIPTQKQSRYWSNPSALYEHTYRQITGTELYYEPELLRSIKTIKVSIDDPDGCLPRHQIDVANLKNEIAESLGAQLTDTAGDAPVLTLPQTSGSHR